MRLQIQGSPLTINDPTLGTATLWYRIDNVNITAECTIEVANDETMTVLHWYVIAMVGASVDAIAFTRGVGVTVIVDRCMMPDGREGPIGLRDDELMNSCSVNYDDLLLCGAREGATFKLIQDLVWTIFRPLDAPINCARAVEGFRKLMYPIPEEEEKEKGRDAREWEFMQENLNLSLGYLKFVTDISKGPRHGKVGSVRLGDIGNARKHAWTVANRFIEFRKRGNLKLPESEFPLK